MISNAATRSHNIWPFNVEGAITSLSIEGHLRASSSASVVSLALAGAGVARINDVVGNSLVLPGKLNAVQPKLVAHGSNSIYAVILSPRHRTPKILTTIAYLELCFTPFIARPSD